MEEEVERPVCRALFRQASHETRLNPTAPSDSDDSEYEDNLCSGPRIVDVLVKQGSAVKTPDQPTTVTSKENVTDGDATSPTDNENESGASKNDTRKSDRIGYLRVDHRGTQEKDRPATVHESELRKEVNIPVIAQDKERPTTIHNVETERYKQDDKTHDDQMESVGALKGKIHKGAKKCLLGACCRFSRTTPNKSTLHFLPTLLDP
jgi:hypothetical protein